MIKTSDSPTKCKVGRFPKKKEKHKSQRPLQGKLEQAKSDLVSISHATEDKRAVDAAPGVIIGNN